MIMEEHSPLLKKLTKLYRLGDQSIFKFYEAFDKMYVDKTEGREWP